MTIPGQLVISFDFELGWGVLDSPVWRERERVGTYQRLRSVLPQLFDLLRQLHLPTTWGVVSSMLTEREAGLALDHLPPAYARAVRTFFHEAQWQTRCGTDLLECWQSIASFSELCSHSSTHIHAGYPGLAAEIWVRDIVDSCESLEYHHGSAIRSVIFPRDEAQFRLALAAERQLHCRLSPSFMLPSNKVLRRIERLRQQLGGLSESWIVQGAFGETYQNGTLFFNWPAGRMESLRHARLLRQQSTLLAALQRGERHHVWLHPFNLARTAAHLEAFTGLLTQVARLRDAGRVEVLTMTQAGGSR